MWTAIDLNCSVPKIKLKSDSLTYISSFKTLAADKFGKYCGLVCTEAVNSL